MSSVLPIDKTTMLIFVFLIYQVITFKYFFNSFTRMVLFSVHCVLMIYAVYCAFFASHSENETLLSKNFFYFVQATYE